MVFDEFLNSINIFLLQKRKILFVLVVLADVIAIIYLIVFFDIVDVKKIINYTNIEIIHLYNFYVNFYIIILLNMLLYISDKKETFSLLSHEDLIKYYKNEKIITLESNEHKIESNSVLIIDCCLLIDKIKLTKNDGRYELPWFIQEYGINKLLQEFALDNKKDLRNKLTLSLINAEIKGDELTMDFRKATYFDSLLTNSSSDSKIIYNLTIRDLLEPGPSLNPLKEALSSNHLGINCLVITNDDYILIPQRNQNVNDFKSNLSPSVSGALNLDIAYNENNKNISILNAIENEFIEEINFQEYFDSKKSMSQYIEKNCKLIGLTRELLRLGKPESFFILETMISKDTLSNNLILYNKNGESNNESKENIQYFFISKNNLERNIKESIKGQYSFIINNYYYKISEPLLVNMLLYIKQEAKNRKKSQDNSFN